MRNQDYDINCAVGASPEAAVNVADYSLTDLVSYLEQLDDSNRVQAFERLPASRWIRVYSALSPAKQHRQLAFVLARLRDSN
ncbi:Mg/Co/Ni transporter MgtE [Natronocella acetinitrilica]|jgi:hypothetical protein|uniref:Mg/Co/Ni transporter MgtE n=1 Tax=Natronocella acetinitrilica TaxID=414046 RepID=A0AAE3G6E8_9GAMM|nr:hypothetical protein [Natronocella acetinitrilica]MCP1676720.1 Mg/Co/Ni transporter MgtE [Natronocella acetinitrilica]